MPRLESQLATFEEWTFRYHLPQTRPGRILLMIHGWTGDENSMWVFPAKFPTNYWLLAPRAPWEASPSGFSWRESRNGWPTLDDFRTAGTRLMDFVDSWALANGVDAGTFDVIGFSQGAAVAATLSFLYPQRIGKMGLLAGFVPLGSNEITETRPLAGKHVFMAHGTRDETVPIDLARASLNILKEAGAETTFHEADVAHKLSVDGLKALEQYLRN